MTHTLITITTTLSKGYVVTSVGGRTKWGGEATNDGTEGLTWTWKSFDETSIVDYDGGPGDQWEESVGPFGAHDAVVASLEFTTGAKIIQREQITTVTYDHETDNDCVTVTQEGK